MTKTQDLEDIESLIAACEEEFVPGEEYGPFDDDEGVMLPETPITFGMIRRARIALDSLKGEA